MTDEMKLRDMSNAIVNWVDDGEHPRCVECGDYYNVLDGRDGASALCDPCAQMYASEFATLVPRLLDEVDRLRARVQELEPVVTAAVALRLAKMERNNRAGWCNPEGDDDLDHAVDAYRARAIPPKLETFTITDDDIAAVVAATEAER